MTTEHVDSEPTDTIPTMVHKVTLFIIDHDGLGPTGIKSVLETTRYPNRCIAPYVSTDIQTITIDFHDNHVLNYTHTQGQAFMELFDGHTK